MMKPAFSMLTSIFVILLMATVGIFVMSLSGKIVKATTAQYQYAQAELYAKSYTEYAILAITGNNRATNCLQTITGTIGTPSTGDGYSIRTHIAYIGNNGIVGTCAGGVRQLNGSTVISTNRTPLTVIIDVYIDYKDPDNTGGSDLTVHRRSVQKI